MKKTAFFLCILLCLSFLSVLPCGAAEEMVQGYISNALTNSNISGDYVKALVLTADRTKHIYTLAKRVTVNGTVFTPKETEEFDAIADQIRNQFAEIRLNGEQITEITTDTEPEELTYVLYDPATGRFSGVDKVLPVFDDCGAYIPALDADHYYTIEVYDYAVNITRKTAKAEDMATVHQIAAESSAQPNFLLALTVEFEARDALESTEVPAVCKAKLYDADGDFLQEAETDVSFPYLYFNDLPNENRGYKVTLWLESAEGKTISPACTILCTTAALPVYSGFMDAAGTTEDISGEHIIVRIRDAKGEKHTYSCFGLRYIGNERITDLQTAIDSLLKLTRVEFMCDGTDNINMIRPFTMKREWKDCNVSGAAVYKDRFEAEVQFEETYEKPTALVLVALYDENGKLTGWTFKTVDVPKDRSESVPVNVSMDASENYVSSKLFLWETLLGPCS